ncbi:MAG: 23S rRNA (pseudouridine(1915)-N(3))-methyltransferase RlmH [Christensenellales bacterium]|jgi:23S rRNA (pseudouridine1915-N3)-methyltransferase
MTGIRLVCVGRMKEKFFAQAAGEYVKRLSRYADIKIVEVPDSSAPEKLSEAQKKQVIDAEGQRVLKAAQGRGYIVALDPAGRKLDSLGFADMLDRASVSGGSRICFIIGGSMGLSDEVKAAADMLVSFSDMTFPHNLFRIMLLEQIYRGYKILAGEPYHK